MSQLQRYRELSRVREGQQEVWRGLEPHERSDISTIARFPVPSWPVAKYTDNRANCVLFLHEGERFDAVPDFDGEIEVAAAQLNEVFLDEASLEVLSLARVAVTVPAVMKPDVFHVEGAESTSVLLHPMTAKRLHEALGCALGLLDGDEVG